MLLARHSVRRQHDRLRWKIHYESLAQPRRSCAALAGTQPLLNEPWRGTSAPYAVCFLDEGSEADSKAGLNAGRFGVPGVDGPRD
jgi:hypothetical protein